MDLVPPSRLAHGERSMTEPPGAQRHLNKRQFDTLPPDPGMSSIPEGHIRLWHYTSAHNAPGIAAQGLLRSKARGDSGTGDLTEPSAGVWASTRRPDDILGSRDTSAAVVEFHAPPGEISGNAESPRQAMNKDRTWDNAKVQDWAQGNHHVIMRDNVNPSNISAIHEGWHGAARYMRDTDPSLKTYQWLHAENDDDPMYAPYIRGLNALEHGA